MSKGKTYPVIDPPVHGEHDGEKFSSIPQSLRKQQPFFKVTVIYFPYMLAVQIIIFLTRIMLELVTTTHTTTQPNYYCYY